jgi:hypothetical protein
MFNKFITSFDIREVGAPIGAANNTDSNSDIIDMTGYDGVVFIGSVTDSAATGVGTLKVETSLTNADGGMSALSGASAAGTCAVNDDLNDRLLMVEVVRPSQRYVQAVRTSATANIAFGTLIAILYKERKLPITADTTVIASAAVITA